MDKGWSVLNYTEKGAASTTGLEPQSLAWDPMEIWLEPISRNQLTQKLPGVTEPLHSVKPRGHLWNFQQFI